MSAYWDPGDVVRGPDKRLAVIVSQTREFTDIIFLPTQDDPHDWHTTMPSRTFEHWKLVGTCLLQDGKISPKDSRIHLI